MPVAKSFQDLLQLSEPFSKNGKEYIKVQLKSGKEKEVRYYTEREYAKLYPTNKTTTISGANLKRQKEVLGFQRGYITVYQGVTTENERWFILHPSCRCTSWWGWYTISEEEVPNDLPLGVKPIVMNWNDVSDETGTAIDPIKAKSFLKNHQNKISQGKIGERIERNVIITNVTQKEDQWGTNYIHWFQDKQGEYYVWKTKTKCFQAGIECKLIGTIQEEGQEKGLFFTRLVRCKVE